MPSPRLTDHADGGALAVLKSALATAQRENVIAEGAPKIDPWVTSADPRSVKLQDCVDGTHWLQYTKSGALKNDRPGSHNKTEATVTYENGIWKVTTLDMYEAGTCG